jgi:hypothetical protein
LTKQAGGIWRDQTVSGPLTSPAVGARPTNVTAVNAFSFHPARTLRTFSRTPGLASGKAGSHSFSSFAAQRHGTMASGKGNFAANAGLRSRLRPLGHSSAKSGSKTPSGFGSGRQSVSGFKSSPSKSTGDSLDSDLQHDLGKAPQ